MEIKLHPNGWHRRLQKFVFGQGCPLYHNFCPYFWLTNFCILITFLVPIIPLIKLIILICGGISWFFEKAGDYFEETFCKPMFERSALNMDPELLLRSWTLYDENQIQYEEWDNERWQLNKLFRNEIYTNDYKLRSKKQEEMRKKFEVWKTKTPNWQQILEDHKAKKIANMEKWKQELAAQRERTRKQEQEDAERVRLANIRRQKAFTWIVTNTKWIIYPILAGVAAFILYWIYVGISSAVTYMVAHFHYGNFITTMKYVGVILGGALLLFGLVYLLAKIFSKITCRFCFRCPCWLSKTFISLGNGILWLAQKIGNTCVSIWTVIMIFKKNYCPGINWEKEKNH